MENYYALLIAIFTKKSSTEALLEMGIDLKESPGGNNGRRIKINRSKSPRKLQAMA